MEAGAKRFKRIGCADCHVPELDSTIGPLPAYTDLLVHDMGPDFADDLQVGLAGPSEFRTQPLWGVALHGPFLHDGRAETLEDAIRMHGGEAKASRDAFVDLDAADRDEVLAFLEGLGGWEPNGQVKVQPGDDVPDVGEEGGPDRALSGQDRDRFAAGRAIFDRSKGASDGMGPAFNADSCRACHQDPVLGGAGGIDTNVVRYGVWNGTSYVTGDQPLLPRMVVPGQPPVRLPDDAEVIEWRQPPTVLGTGPIDAIAESAILAGADPDDTDGDGISGRARMVDGLVGRYGWKAQIATALDFAADALIVEIGVSVDPALSDFTHPDDDGHPDPELSTASFEDLVFYLEHLGPPLRAEPADAAQAARGEALFAQVGCDACHTPVLDGVDLYSDLLLHDVAPLDEPLVDQEMGVRPTEFRTPPLWGVRDTAPYLHHGRAATLEQAVILGHFGEGDAARQAFEALSEADKAALVAFLETL